MNNWSNNFYKTACSFCIGNIPRNSSGMSQLMNESMVIEDMESPPTFKTNQHQRPPSASGPDSRPIAMQTGTQSQSMNQQYQGQASLGNV